MKSSVTLAVLAVLSILVTGTAASAHAVPSSRLVYAREESADECPDVSAFRKAVAARLGYDPFFPWAEIAVTADIRRVAQRIVGHVSLVDEKGIVRGSREMTAANGDCAELVSSMALAVSIALDSLSAAAPAQTTAPTSLEAEVPSEPQATHAPPPTTPAPASADTAPAAEPHPKTRVVVGAGVLGAAGWAPAPTAGLTLTGGLRWRSLGGEIEARADLPASTDGPAGGGVRSQLFALSALPCLHGALLFGCASMSAARISASGFDVAQAREASALFFAVGGRLGIELELTRSFQMRGYAELDVPLTRPTLRVAGADAWRPSIPSGSLGIALLLQIP